MSSVSSDLSVPTKASSEKKSDIVSIKSSSEKKDDVKGKKSKQKSKSVPTNKKKERPKVEREKERKSYKIMIRKLPTKDFGDQTFKTCLNTVLATLDIKPEFVDILHFMEGKLSRKRGPISGTAFISIKDEMAMLKFLKECPSVIPFLPGEDVDAQPTVSPAPYQKRYRPKGRPDRLAGSIATDTDFLAFCEGLKAPPPSLPSAEAQLDTKLKAAAALEGTKQKKVDPAASNPLLKFLKDKSEKKLAVKLAIRERERAAAKEAAARLKNKPKGGVGASAGSNAGPTGGSSRGAAKGSVSAKAKGNMSSESGGSSQSGALGKSEGAPRAVILKKRDDHTAPPAPVLLMRNPNRPPNPPSTSSSSSSVHTSVKLNSGPRDGSVSDSTDVLPPAPPQTDSSAVPSASGKSKATQGKWSKSAKKPDGGGGSSKGLGGKSKKGSEGDEGSVDATALQDPAGERGGGGGGGRSRRGGRGSGGNKKESSGGVAEGGGDAEVGVGTSISRGLSEPDSVAGNGRGGGGRGGGSGRGGGRGKSGRGRGKPELSQGVTGHLPPAPPPPST